MTIKNYNIDRNVPDRDKIILRPYHDKYQFINAMPDMVEDHSAECAVYFLTVSFKRPKQKIPYDLYREYFHFFRKKLDSALLPNSRFYSNAPFFVMIPEAVPNTHFHGILFINKKHTKKFQRKCVDEIQDEYIEKLDRIKSSIRLKQNIIYPYAKSLIQRNLQCEMIREIRTQNRSASQKTLLHNSRPLLSVDDYRLYPIDNRKEFERSFFYSGKSFLKSRFDYDDVIIEKKNHS